MSGKANLTALGFCGADDSIDPNLLGLICQSYPFVEFGVLFRPDKEGTPRYASPSWVSKLGEVIAKTNAHTTTMRLAAHLCGTRVNEVLDGNVEFLKSLNGVFGRCQINATAVNGVDTSNLAASVPNLLQVFEQFPDIEFIIQKNEETAPIWEGILDCCATDDSFPSNVTFLLDESKGTGLFAGGDWSSAIPTTYPRDKKIGFAGGIGPANVTEVLQGLTSSNNISTNAGFWIDMESSLRSSKNGEDVFDLEKCYECIRGVCALGFYGHPEFLPS